MWEQVRWREVPKYSVGGIDTEGGAFKEKREEKGEISFKEIKRGRESVC